jgi:hypothetical protein
MPLGSYLILLFQHLFQYFADRGSDSGIPNAAIFGFRTKVDF